MQQAIEGKPKSLGQQLLRHFDSAGPAPLDRYALLRVAAALEVTPREVYNALEELGSRGQVRRVGELYIRVLADRRPHAS